MVCLFVFFFFNFSIKRLDSACRLRCMHGGWDGLVSSFFLLTFCELWNSGCKVTWQVLFPNQPPRQPSPMFFCVINQLTHATCKGSTYILFLMSIFFSCQFLKKKKNLQLCSHPTALRLLRPVWSARIRTPAFHPGSCALSYSNASSLAVCRVKNFLTSSCLVV